MKFFNKLKKQKPDKKYLKYKNGKVVEYTDINDLNSDSSDLDEQVYQESKIKQETTPANLKSKGLIYLGILIMITPLIFVFIKSDTNYFSKLTDFMNTGKIEEPVDKEPVEQNNNNNSNNNSNSNNNNSNTDKDLKDETNIEKITPETLVNLNNLANNNMTINYKYLKVDITNFCNGRVSLYSTTKNLNSKRNMAYEKYSNFLLKESLFLKAKQEELFLTIRDRYANYINTIDLIIKDLSRSSSTKLFNEGLEIDNELIKTQTKLLEFYLNEKNVDFLVNPNEIMLN